jgi:hypothetical protein
MFHDPNIGYLIHQVEPQYSRERDTTWLMHMDNATSSYKSSDTPAGHRLVAYASYPATHSVHEFILKNRPSLFLPLPPPLVQHLVAIPVLDVDTPTPCYCCCRPIRCCSLAPIARALHPFLSRVMVLVVLALPIARATHLTEPSPVLVILVAVVLVRSGSCAGC